jgi:hypothetical protein
MKKVNTKLSVQGCWKMVNTANTRERIAIAEIWLRENEVITNDEYNDLMMALSYLSRELYHMGA